MCGIAGGDVFRAEICAQNAFGGRGFLDFGDHAGVAGCDFCAQTAFKRPQSFARFAVAFDFTPQAGEVAVFFGGGDFICFDAEDFIQDVGHGA